MGDEDVQTLTVYVPAAESELRETIAPGSAIVGSEYRDTGRLRIDFEGNLYDLKELEDFDAKVHRAAERHLANDGRGAETVACAYVSPEQVRTVGFYRPSERLLRIEKSDLLRDWRQKADSSFH